MSTEHLRGMGVALTTPFLENGDIDYHTLDMHLDYLIDGKADYIVALGTTAETPTLSADEKHELALHILEPPLPGSDRRRWKFDPFGRQGTDRNTAHG